MTAKIDDYHNLLDDSLKIVYHHRKLYEQSVTILNEAMAALTDDEQSEAQRMFPHYFDSQVTDGVDHNIYLGKSLIPDPETYDDLYLRNLRFWQLKLICKLACLCERLLPYLPIALQTAHIIAVQNPPLSIRFDRVEKKLVVDGAYNIRYEIMKKRIDKATIQGTDERLTMPAKVAIVFSQSIERNEYEKYIAFLRHEGLLEGKTDEIGLNELQGIHGLRALRVNVNIAANLPELDRYIEKVRIQVADTPKPLKAA